jgi:formyl-CoA transferase
MKLLVAADIPVMPIHDLESILQDRHLTQTNFFALTEHPSEGRIRSMKVAARWSETPAEPQRLAPKLGEHSEEVLREVGFSAAEIDALVQSHVVRRPAPAVDI